jgi:hypothetical protein
MDFLAQIVFGPLGASQTRVFRDLVVQAEIRYRIADDKLYGGGPAGPPPSIAAGTLSVVIGGRHRTYDLAAILPLRSQHINLPAGPAGDCGALQALTRRGNYLVIEAVVDGGGCLPAAAFVDLNTGQIAQSTVVDHRWHHQFLAAPTDFSGTKVRVTRADLIALASPKFGPDGKSTGVLPWTFALVHAIDERGTARFFSFGTGGYEPGSARGSDLLPTVGSDAWIGSLQDHGDLAVLRPFGTELVVQWNEHDDARYTSAQTPPPDASLRIARYNAAFMAAGTAARRGRFDDAVRYLALAVDANIEPSLNATLVQCRLLQQDVHAGRISAAAAGAEFENGCQPAN